MKKTNAPNEDEVLKMVGLMTCDFTSFSTVFQSGQWTDDNERLYTSEPRLSLKRSPPHVGLEPGTAISVDQRLTY